MGSENLKGARPLRLSPCRDIGRPSLWVIVLLALISPAWANPLQARKVRALEGVYRSGEAELMIWQDDEGEVIGEVRFHKIPGAFSLEGKLIEDRLAGTYSKEGEQSYQYSFSPSSPGGTFVTGPDSLQMKRVRTAPPQGIWDGGETLLEWEPKPDSEVARELYAGILHLGTNRFKMVGHSYGGLVTGSFLSNKGGETFTAYAENNTLTLRFGDYKGSYARTGYGRKDFRNAVEMLMIQPHSPMVSVGSPASEKGRSPNESFSRSFKISGNPWMSETLVTNTHWQKVIGSSIGSGASLPVVNVSWPEALNFCKKLTELDKSKGLLPQGYRYLPPSEVQWEWACRAGTTTSYWWGDLYESGWLRAGEFSGPGDVDQFPANPWGFRDMGGNVWQWCLDAYLESTPASLQMGMIWSGHGQLRSIRGGRYNSNAAEVRSARRNKLDASERFKDVGFRVVLVPEEKLKLSLGGGADSASTAPVSPQDETGGAIQQYSGHVGGVGAVFSLRWNGTTAAGSYYHPKTEEQTRYTLKASRAGQKMSLDEYTGTTLSARITLVQSIKNGFTRWSGKMKNTDGREFEMEMIEK